MPLSWNEIRDRAITFVREWENETSEDAEAKSFWDAFFNVFGIPRRRIAQFEKLVHKASGKNGYIDLFWPGVMLAEHKSRGKDLTMAHDQAIDYFPGLSDKELPRYIVVSDFARFRLYDLEADTEFEFPLEELPQHITSFGFIAGYESRTFSEQDPVNIDAAERLGRLHDKLFAIGYEGHQLEVYLVRLLFCLFADDTGIFMPRNAFEDFINTRTSEDGSDLAARLNELFEVLNTPPEKRLRNLDEQLAAFPYVNGKLFEEHLRTASFDREMRDLLLWCCNLDWGMISPAIFGSLFQGIMDAKVRRNLGAHYTSEKNILKLISALFLDDLKAEFERVKTQPAKLRAFHDKLGSLNFFDPACGCGNFLVITYREIRLLELEVIKRLYKRDQQQLAMDAVAHYVKVDVDQFHGIEIEEWPAQIARVAMWLIDHQMNLLVGQTFGDALVRIPLIKSANIVNRNALRIDWEEVVPAERCSYVLGNPPFVGAKMLSDAQREDIQYAIGGIKNFGLLDFVAAWYIKAARYAPASTLCAFVSTNSITQGEQAGVLWPVMLDMGIQIHFAHRTFQWRNEAKGVAAVHCIIVGFGQATPTKRVIYDYLDIRGEAQVIAANNINPYLVDAPDVVLQNRSKPLCKVPKIGIGNKPIDGGHYLFSTEERDEFIKAEPQSAPWFFRWLGAEEFINGLDRWCLWLGDCPPHALRSMPLALKRIEAVKQFRLASKSAPTRKLAQTPTRFHVENMPVHEYLLIPRHSSQTRPYLPIGFIEPTTLSGDANLVIADGSIYVFAILSSTMHNAWMRTVCGRLKSDFRYSAGIVYNNFPWPTDPTPAQVKSIEDAAKAVLNARAQFDESCLADLYDPLTMPPELMKAHRDLDRAVDAAYVNAGGKKAWKSDAERVAFLFELYLQLQHQPQ